MDCLAKIFNYIRKRIQNVIIVPIVQKQELKLESLSYQLIRLVEIESRHPDLS